MPGQRRDKDTHYYPVMKLPQDYSVTGCCHIDISVNNLALYWKELPWKYRQNIKYLLELNTEKEFKK
jgi:hypothetical protein